MIGRVMIGRVMIGRVMIGRVMIGRVMIGRVEVGFRPKAPSRTNQTKYPAATKPVDCPEKLSSAAKDTASSWYGRGRRLGVPFILCREREASRGDPGQRDLAFSD